MNRRWLPLAILAVGLLVGSATGGQAQSPVETSATRENIEAALKLTQACAAEYEIRVGDRDKPLDLQREPVLRWSNPARGEIYSNVFLWTRDGRPLVVASFNKWFSPYTNMGHEFHSLAEEPLAAKFHGTPVWKATEAGLRFADIPKAGAPAVGEAQRVLQFKDLAKEFGVTKKERSGAQGELRLLPQPIHRYAAPKQGIVNGAVFAFVEGTDPELFLLIEARGPTPASARWQFAAARMNAEAQLRLRHRDQQVWVADHLTTKEIHDPKRVYTIFQFKEIPDFLKDALAKPNP